MNYVLVIGQLEEKLFKGAINMNITETINLFPDYAKDIKLNYSKVLNEQILNNKQLYSIILISSFASQSTVLKNAALEETKKIYR
jgi:hypothetical protein